MLLSTLPWGCMGKGAQEGQHPQPAPALPGPGLGAGWRVMVALAQLCTGTTAKCATLKGLGKQPGLHPNNRAVLLFPPAY